MSVGPRKGPRALRPHGARRLAQEAERGGGVRRGRAQAQEDEEGGPAEDAGGSARLP